MDELLDELEGRLTDLGSELDDLREALGRKPDEPGEGTLAEAFDLVRRIRARPAA